MVMAVMLMGVLCEASFASRAVCGNCHGSGREACSTCGGSGICPICHNFGSRKSSCAGCHGSGRCYKCGGSGMQTCRSCGGSGPDPTPNPNGNTSGDIGGEGDNSLPLSIRGSIQSLAVGVNSFKANQSINGGKIANYLIANNGTPPYKWTIVKGEIPRGLGLYVCDVEGIEFFSALTYQNTRTDTSGFSYGEEAR